MSTFLQSTPLPDAAAVRELLEATVGRDVDFEVGTESLTPATDEGLVIAEFIEDATDAPMALIAVDVPLGAVLGASIALMPPRVVDDAAGMGVLPEGLLENVYEVFNIMSSLFNVPGAPHLKLNQLYETATGLLPASIATWLRGYVPRLDARVSVRGYGEGRMSVLIK
jgi:hypothetical protein